MSVIWVKRNLRKKTDSSQVLGPDEAGLFCNFYVHAHTGALMRREGAGERKVETMPFVEFMRSLFEKTTD